MLRDALLTVSADEKELVGQTIADLVRLSSQAGLKSSVVTITGPIIRILGDRYSSGIRSVMFEALNSLIEKVIRIRTVIIESIVLYQFLIYRFLQCGVLIKPFVPQIQTTVSRAFSDPVRIVRVKAGAVAANIGKVIQIKFAIKILTCLKNGNFTIRSLAELQNDKNFMKTFLHVSRWAIIIVMVNVIVCII